MKFKKPVLLTALAVVAFTAAAAVAQPTNLKTADDYNRLGLQQANRSEHVAAVASYSRCIALKPDHSECFYNRGYVYWEMQKFAEAESDFTRVIALDPTNPASYSMRGTVHYAQGQYAKAIPDYSKTISLDPKRVIAYYNRALSYYYDKKYTLAKLDLTNLLKIDPNYVDAYYQRGKMRTESNERVGATADLKAVLRLDPNHQRAKEILAGLEKPIITPTTSGNTGGTKLPALSQVTAKSAGPRMELKGTGLSVATPQPFEMKQDKPDPLIENQTANVFWTLSHRDIFANVRYVKSTDGKTPRTELEVTAKLVSETNGSPMPRIVDATFLGKPAAQFEEEFVDAYDPKKVKRKRKMLAYGQAGEVTTIQISYPSADATVGGIAESIFCSFQASGAVAQSVSKVPPANWQYMNFKGLRFEVPDAKSVTNCGAKVAGPTIYNSTPYCYTWGENNIVRVEYRTYNIAMPTAAQAAQTHVDILKKIDIDTKTRAARTYSTENIFIAGATAVKVKAYTGYGTAGTNQETFFIRRGNEMWVLETSEFIRWNYTKEAVQRIAASVRF